MLLTSTNEASAAGAELARRHFVDQDARPPGLVDVDVAALDPFLRTLLFTDGTVTRTLEVWTLSSVVVDVVHQQHSTTPPTAARQLEVSEATESIRRRVTMTIGDTDAPAVCAESYIVPDRLPAGFLGLLGKTPEGIGESLRQSNLDSWRELLWFGLGGWPAWAAPAETEDVLTRLYRVMTDAKPALLICEAFAVEAYADGGYRLVGMADYADVSV